MSLHVFAKRRPAKREIKGTETNKAIKPSDATRCQQFRMSITGNGAPLWWTWKRPNKNTIVSGGLMHLTQ